MENATRYEISDHYLKILYLTINQHKNVKEVSTENQKLERVYRSIQVAVTPGILSRNKNSELADGEVENESEDN